MSSNPVVSRRSSRLQQKHSSPSPFMDLHPEIWEFILKKVTQKEALNLRFGNKDFKSKVDNLYEDWVIRLDENCPYLDIILNLRVKEVQVVKLLNPILHQSQRSFLKFPDLLKTINVDNSDISGQNLHALLAHKNLKNIYISLDDSALQDVFWNTLDPQIGYDFPKLISLEIILLVYTGKLLEGNPCERILTQSRIQKLRSLSVRLTRSLSEALIYRLISNLIFFLGQNGKTLKHFSFESLFLREFIFTGFPPLDVRALLRNCSSLETLEISYQRDVELFSHIFERLIENQSKLVHIKFSTPSDTLTLCTKLCAKNFETLTLVDFKVVSPGIKDQFDVSVFRNCVNLKKLFLYVLLRGFKIEVLNLSTLPEQIEILCLTGFNFYSSDLSSFLKNHGFLSNFSIKWPEAGSNYGVNETVLRDCLNHSSLKYFTVSQACYRMESNEVEKINEILSTLCVNKIDYLWQLRLDKTIDSNGNPAWIPSKDKK